MNQERHWRSRESGAAAIRAWTGASIRLARAAVLATPLSLFAWEGLAETPADGHSGAYRLNAAVQSPPLRVEVLDGERFRDIETRVVYRLYGLETCAPGQIASLGRQPWPCGTMAAAWLVKATLGRWIACNTLREDKDERLARCSSADHADIGADMLRDGIAVTVPPTDGEPPIRAYVAVEAEARKAYRGLWALSFESLSEFRAREPQCAGRPTAEAAP